MFTQKSQKSPNHFYCEKCDYNTSKKGDYDRHLQTQKHKNNEILINGALTVKVFTCECGKKYKHNQSLYNHKKKCDFKVIIGNKTEENSCQVILQNNVENIDTNKQIEWSRFFIIYFLIIIPLFVIILIINI